MRVEKELVSYCLVGLVNTFVGISTAYVFLNILMMSYLVSVTAAYLTGIFTSFLLNKKYTFDNQSKSYFKLFAKFVFTMLPSYIIAYYFGYYIVKMTVATNIIDSILLYLSQLTGFETSRLVDNIAVLTSMAIYLVLGFSVNKFIVFKQKTSPNE